MEKKSKKLLAGDILLIVAILILAYLYFKPAPAESHPANVVLSKFIDLYDKNITSVEIWLENIGEKDAYNISVFIRCRDQNGTILFNKTIGLTARFLRPNETCSAVYFVEIDNATKLYYTIEIRWNGGMNSYLIEKVRSGAYVV